MNLPYWIIDAFTDRIFAGNPAAVVLPETPLPTELMQSIAAENNLSETAFATPETDGYRLRWFTPTVEVDLCGHATLATSFVLALRNIPGPYRYHTRSGTLTATTDGANIVLDFPVRTHQPAATPPGITEALGTTPLEVFQSADLVAVLDSPATVAALRPNPAAIRALPGGALIVTAAGGQGADITSRYFAPAYGIEEDPVTGSLHTQIIPYWAEKLGKQTLVCHQASPRGGFMTCTLARDRVLLSGTAKLYATGTLHIPKQENHPPKN